MSEDNSPHHGRWWDNVIPFLIVAAGALAPAPLEHGRYAIAGALVCAIIARIALPMWRLSGLSEVLQRAATSLQVESALRRQAGQATRRKSCEQPFPEGA